MNTHSFYTIHPLNEYPQFTEICAAWEFGRWGFFLFHDIRFEEVMHKYELCQSPESYIPFTYIAVHNQFQLQ